jgi:hypothetical protein
MSDDKAALVAALKKELTRYVPNDPEKIGFEYAMSIVIERLTPTEGAPTWPMVADGSRPIPPGTEPSREMRYAAPAAAPREACNHCTSPYCAGCECFEEVLRDCVSAARREALEEAAELVETFENPCADSECDCTWGHQWYVAHVIRALAREPKEDGRE